ncbi:MAG: hypothetical protein JWN83_1893 [Chitinophagaceae bacterium]|nr:hypothetical protein [Chitinophagaceae bacterium]
MIKFFKKIFGIRKQNDGNKLFPADWKLTISDLMDELKSGKRKEIKDPEMTWAREYERSLIPSNYHFPRKGDLYVANFDQEVDFLTSWSAPYTGGGTTMLFKDEQVWVDTNPLDEKPIGTYLLAVNYNELEKRIVSESDRNAFKYDSFYFHISTKTLNENFKLLKTGFDKENFS